jgi:hypothetical protein
MHLVFLVCCPPPALWYQLPTADVPLPGFLNYPRAIATATLDSHHHLPYCCVLLRTPYPSNGWGGGRLHMFTYVYEYVYMNIICVRACVQGHMHFYMYIYGRNCRDARILCAPSLMLCCAQFIVNRIRNNWVFPFDIASTITTFFNNEQASILITLDIKIINWDVTHAICQRGRNIIEEPTALICIIKIFI